MGIVIAAAVAVVLFVIGIVYAWKRHAERKAAARRISGARVRSGVFPDELPTSFSGLAPLATDGPPAPQALNEEPLIIVRIVGRDGKKRQRRLQVQGIDIARRRILVVPEPPDNIQRVPLDAITDARDASTGKRFDIETWFEAVRVARRKRGAN